MVQIYQNIGQLILMLALLCASAFFSGAETAFFNLSQRQIKLFRQSGHRLQMLVARIMENPRRLLSALLFGNMLVNVFFFALASVTNFKVQHQYGVTAATVSAAVFFCILVLFGEMFPKSLAYANSRTLSVWAALPAFMLLQLLGRILSFFEFLILSPMVHILASHGKRAKPITSGEFKLLVRQMRKHGLITADENKLLEEIVELGFLKVRHVMRPRVDMVVCAISDSNQKAREVMRNHRLTKLPVHSGQIDNIVGMVHLRQLLLESERPLERLIQPVQFVPEQKTVESLLEFFRQTQTDTAVVVDEYGGIAGLILLEDIAEELVGPIEVAQAIKPIEKIGPFEYRMVGNISIYDWADVFGIDPAQTRTYTIAGLVAAILGKIPKEGDVAHWKNLKFTVERVRKHRIEAVILSLEPVRKHG